MLRTLGKGAFGGTGATMAYLTANSDGLRTLALWLGILISVLTALKLTLELSGKYFGWPKRQDKQ